MKDIINLNNNYYIKIVNQNNEMPLEFINITNFKLINVLKKESIIFKIDFNEFSQKKYKQILKKILFTKNIAMKIKKNFGLEENENRIVAYVFNFDENDITQKNFIMAIKAIFLTLDMKDIITYTIQYVII